MGHPLYPTHIEIVEKRTISAEGLALIKRFEGLRLLPYLDVSGIWTQGFGHTLGVTRHSPLIDPYKATLWLLSDLTVAEQTVTATVHIKLSQHQFDALVSFVFTVGENLFAQSEVLQHLNVGDYIGAVAAMQHYDRARHHQHVHGLIERRAAEGELFTRPDVGTPF